MPSCQQVFASRFRGRLASRCGRGGRGRRRARGLWRGAGGVPPRGAAGRRFQARGGAEVGGGAPRFHGRAVARRPGVAARPHDARAQRPARHVKSAEGVGGEAEDWRAGAVHRARPRNERDFPQRGGAPDDVSTGEATDISSVQMDFELSGYAAAKALETGEAQAYGPLLVLRRKSTRGRGRRSNSASSSAPPRECRSQFVK